MYTLQIYRKHVIGGAFVLKIDKVQFQFYSRQGPKFTDWDEK